MINTEPAFYATSDAKKTAEASGKPLKLIIKPFNPI